MSFSKLIDANFSLFYYYYNYLFVYLNLQEVKILGVKTQE